MGVEDHSEQKKRGMGVLNMMVAVHAALASAMGGGGALFSVPKGPAMMPTRKPGYVAELPPLIRGKRSRKRFIAKERARRKEITYRFYVDVPHRTLQHVNCLVAIGCRERMRTR